MVGQFVGGYDRTIVECSGFIEFVEFVGFIEFFLINDSTTQPFN